MSLGAKRQVIKPKGEKFTVEYETELERVRALKVGERLGNWRRELRMSFSDMGEHCCVDMSYISNIEYGKKVPGRCIMLVGRYLLFAGIDPESVHAWLKDCGLIMPEVRDAAVSSLGLAHWDVPVAKTQSWEREPITRAQLEAVFQMPLESKQRLVSSIQRVLLQNRAHALVNG